MTAIATALTGLLALGIATIGAVYLLRPDLIAPGFGWREPPELPNADTAVKGVRDLTSGLILAVLLLVAPPVVIGAVMLAAAVTPLGDMAIVLAHNGRRAIAFGVHGATAAVVVATAALWLLA